MTSTVDSIALGGVLLLAGTPLLWGSPRRPRPLVDEGGNPLAGSISEKAFFDINGLQQGMFIKGRSAKNPVLLYLHGGMPEYFLTERHPIGLEDRFTVVWWEQRGSGLSYRPTIPRGTITSELMISDTVALTNRLRERFGQEKIYLMGHSGGTFVAVQAAARAPHLYHAYIGVAQMSNQLESEKLAYDYMLRQFRVQGNAKMVRRLEAAPVTMEGGTPRPYLALRDRAMHPLGIGTTHDMRSHITGVFLSSLRCRDYTLREKVRLWRAKASSGVSPLWDEMITTDLSKRVTELQVPVYFFSGIHDYTVNYTLAKKYFRTLQAPVKGFYSFEHSAHSPVFEEPQKARRILQGDVLTKTNGLADTK